MEKRRCTSPKGDGMLMCPRLKFERDSFRLEDAILLAQAS